MTTLLYSFWSQAFTIYIKWVSSGTNDGIISNPTVGLSLGTYHYTIDHRPGTRMCHVDASSKFPLRTLLFQFPLQDMSFHQLVIWQTLVLLLHKLNIQQIKIYYKLVEEHWTPSTSYLELAQYFNHQQEINVLDGWLLWGSRMIIHPTGRSILFNKLSEAQPGMSKMKSLERCYMWWLGLDWYIECQFWNFSKCQNNQASPSKAPFHLWHWPHRPWS